MTESLEILKAQLATCNLCKDRFAATATAHEPRPVVWFGPRPRILIVGQAPGQRVHQSGKPFADPSGDRLRDWMGVDEETFYDCDRIAIAPMAFCFPGYDANGSDLPPPPICAATWRDRIMRHMGDVRLTIVIGGYAMKWHLKQKASVTEAVSRWRDHVPLTFALPHPSWRNIGWLRRNPWFDAELLPILRARVEEVLNE